MSTHQSLSNQMTRFMDFAGGTVVHVNFFALLVLMGVMSLVVWSIKRKR